MKINPYLNFNGNCAEAFAFYKKILNGKIDMMFKQGEAPIASEIPREQHHLIMHLQMTVGDFELMGCDAPADYYKKPQGQHVALQVDTIEEANRLYHALLEGGQAQMPLQETFWAKRFAMLTDQFGIAWMINCAKPFEINKE